MTALPGDDFPQMSQDSVIPEPTQESATLSTGYDVVDDQAWQGTLEPTIVSDLSPQLARGPP